jgi:hypothetical protein
MRPTRRRSEAQIAVGVRVSGAAAARLGPGYRDFDSADMAQRPIRYRCIQQRGFVSVTDRLERLADW